MRRRPSTYVTVFRGHEGIRGGHGCEQRQRLRIFVLSNWDGVELELSVSPDMPRRIEPRARPVPP